MRAPPIALLALAALLAACVGGGLSEFAGSGGVTAHAVWPAGSAGAQPLASQDQPIPGDVVSVRLTVSGTGFPAVSATFAAALRTGEVTGVPAGTDRTLTLEALDAVDTPIYRGQATGITVTAGAVTDAGPVSLALVDALGGLAVTAPSASNPYASSTTIAGAALTGTCDGSAPSTVALSGAAVRPAADCAGGVFSFDLTGETFVPNAGDYVFTLTQEETFTGEAATLDWVWQYEINADLPPAALPQMSLHLRADAGLTLVNTNEVEAWADQSGKGNHALFDNGDGIKCVLRPTVAEGAINGKPALHFVRGTSAANTMCLTVVNNPGGWLQPTDGITVFAVAQSTSTSTWQVFVLKNTDGEWVDGWGLSRGSNGQQAHLWVNAYNAVTNGGLAWGMNDWEILTGRYGKDRPAPQFDVTLNVGATVVTKTGTAAMNVPPSKVWIGNDPFLTNAGGLDGDIAEILIYDTALGDTEFQQVLDYLEARYDTAAN